MLLSEKVLVKNGLNVRKSYEKAIEHYSNLRSNMIKKIINNKNNNIRKEYLDKIEKYYTDMLITETELGQKKTEQKAEELLQDTSKKIIESFLSDNKKLTQLQDTVNNFKVEKDSDKREFKESYTSRITDSLKRRQNKSLISLKKQDIINELPDRYKKNEDIVNQLNSYILRVLYNTVISEDKKINNDTKHYIQSLSGYFREIYEVDELKSLLLKTISNIKIANVGSKKINEKDTEIDILFYNLNTIEQNLNKNEEIKCKISALSDQDIEELDKDLSNILKEIDFFGEQSKSWKLSKYSFYGYSIGYRSVIFNQLLNEDGVNPYSQLQSIHYLSRLKNIIGSIGPTNVLFSTGDGRYWTADLIKSFREQELLLAFDRETTKSPLNNHVILTKLFNKGIRVY